MQLVRRSDLSMSIEGDGRVLVRVPVAGIGARIPPIAVGVLAFCGEPRSEEDVTRAFGPPGATLFRGLADAGLLVTAERARETPVFFDNFASLDTHRRMLADDVRLDAYARALAEVAPGRVVLDAGTGSGVLAGLAARSGARRVFAVDQAEIVDLAAEVMRRSGLHELVTVIRADLASVRLPEPVDVIVTETFGALALAEGSSDDLVRCAERNLAPGGIVVPKAVQLWLAPVGDRSVLDELMVPLTRDDLDLSPLREASLGRSVTQPVAASALLHPGLPLARVPFPSGGEISGELVFDPIPEGVLVGLAGWFVLELTDSVHLPTGPSDPMTHWQQVFLPIAPVPVGGHLVITAEVSVPPDDRRALTIAWDWASGGDHGRAEHRIR